MCATSQNDWLVERDGWAWRQLHWARDDDHKRHQYITPRIANTIGLIRGMEKNKQKKKLAGVVGRVAGSNDENILDRSSAWNMGSGEWVQTGC